jgi:tetratricopeptide (TPR) repeat protein
MKKFRRAMLGVAPFSILFCAVSFSAEADRWQSLVDAGNGAVRKQQYVAAKKFFDQALKEAERAGFDDPRLSKSFKLIGDLYFMQKRYDEARTYYSRSEACDVNAGNLRAADMDFAAGDFVRAKEAAQMALKQVESKVGAQDVLLAPSLLRLAKAEKALMQEGVAGETLNRVLRILRGTNEESKEFASALDLLGQVYDDQTKYTEAEPLLRRALTIRQKTLNPDDSELEATFTHLAEHYRGMGRAADAEPFAKQAAAVREQGLVHLKEYVDKENGFRLRVPNAWTNNTATTALLIPGFLVSFQSSDAISGVLVQRFPMPAGRDASAVYESAGATMAFMGKVEEIGEENILLSGLPARRIVLSMTSEKMKLRDWATLLATQSQLWILQILGPEDAMSSTDTAYYRAAQSISESFAFLDPVLQVVKNQAVAPPPPLVAITADGANCRRYFNRDVAMQIALPDGWHEAGETVASLREGKTVVLNRTGTLAVVILGREELEASPELYLKTLRSNMVQGTENFQEFSLEKATHQGLQGTRTVWLTRESGVDYRNLVEVFSAGNQHYRLIARAPTEVFDRYATAFNAMLESVQFLSVAAQPPADNLPPIQANTRPRP